MGSICSGLDEESYDYFSDSFKLEITPKWNAYLPQAEEAEEAARRDALNSRIQLVAQNYRTATYEIDRSILATVPSISFRNAAIQRWEKKQSSHKTYAWTAVALTIGSLAMVFSPAPYIGLVSVVTAIYAGVQFRKKAQASNQIAEWKVDPAVRLASERKQAYEKGFSYVYNNDLKLGKSSHHAVLLPHEVEYLYNRYFDCICGELSIKRCVNNQQKKNWLDSFLTDNPISHNVLLYVFGKMPEEFSSLSCNFESIASSLRSIEKEFSNLRAEKKIEADQIFKRIESERIIATAIPEAALQYKLNEARNERDQGLRANEGVSSDQIRQEYESKKRTYHSLYITALLPINLYFDGKVKEAESALKDTLSIISTQEANAFSPYYEYSQGIVAATIAAKKPGWVYTQQPFNLTQQLPIPSFPKIEINFVHQFLAPEVY